MKVASFKVWSAPLASLLLRLLAATWRIRIHGSIPQSASVLAFWHGEMLPVWKTFAHSNASALISQSNDGSLLARLLEDWNYELVRGSSSKGGKEALERLAELAGRTLTLITPDGPRGPRHSFKAGAIIAAQRASVPLVLCRAQLASERDAWRFSRSWDKFCLPKPFARVTLVIDEPIRILLGDDVATLTTYCTERMNTLVERVPISTTFPITP
jgi:lysophospholipid acyltransferase (LPLAT)-like uncharacterized protein